MDQLGQRTLFTGLLIGLAIYGVGFVLATVLEGPRGQWVAAILTLGSMAWVISWYIAVRRGFRIGAKTRQGKRLRSRGKDRPARRPPF